MTVVVTLTKDNFEDEAYASEKPVLIDFWAPWCGPCMMLSPIVDQIANELAGKVKVCKVNISEECELAEHFHVMSIPALIVLKNGRLAATTVGMRHKKEILKMLKL